MKIGKIHEQFGSSGARILSAPMGVEESVKTMIESALEPLQSRLAAPSDDGMSSGFHYPI